jgi:glycosyltransferase involved in cell wall biosynthesis
MKILVLTHEFPPVGGGGGRVAQDIARGLAQRGHELRILTAHLDGLPPSETVAGVRVERLSRQRKAAFRADFAEMARYDLSALKSGLKIVREWQPEVIHAHFAVPAGAAAYVLSKLTGVPYVLTAHLGDVPGAVPEKTDRWFKWVYPFTPAIWKNAAKIVAVSEFTRGLAQKHYQIPMEVIPNGVDLSALPPRQSSGGIPRLVFAGRFVETKNPGHLVSALVQLRNLPWTCAMLGDGPLLESVRETVTNSGLAKRFFLPGWVTPEQVLAQFAQSDLLILPSRSEGLSVVGVQALAMGLALVLSDAGGNLELVENGVNGFTFPTNNIAALTESLKKLLQNPSMLQSAQAKSRQLAQKYDLDTVVSQYETLFQSLTRHSSLVTHFS